MQKKIMIFLLFCFCFLITGCSKYPAVGLVNNSDGTILEYYYIPFPESKMQDILAPENTKKIIEAKNEIKKTFDKIFQDCINLYVSDVNSSTEINIKEKEAMINGVSYESNLTEADNFINFEVENIQYTLTFKNSICYNSFKKSNNGIKEKVDVVTEKSLFTTTKKVIKRPIFDNSTNYGIPLGKKCLDVANEIMQSTLGLENWNLIKKELNYENVTKNFNYIYVVPTARLRSNADEVVKQGNYYYHIWKISTNNLDETNNSITKIEYWTTSANRVVWYLIALSVSFITITIIYIVGKLKEKKNQTEN